MKSTTDAPPPIINFPQHPSPGISVSVSFDHGQPPRIEVTVFAGGKVYQNRKYIYPGNFQSDFDYMWDIIKKELDAAINMERKNDILKRNMEKTKEQRYKS
jgi:hypothetical protein